MKLHFLTFWAINGAMDSDRLKRQLQEMKQAGFDGTIFHPRYYPGTPPFMGEEYLRILSETILEAKALGLEFWIYDENGWPSASGDGRVLAQYPDSRCQWLAWKDGQVCLESRTSFNTFRRDEMQFFVRTIYDGYRLGLTKEAFDYVTGFFSDEVGFLDGHGASIDKGGIPWCEEAAERVRAELGEFRPALCGRQRHIGAGSARCGCGLRQSRRYCAVGLGRGLVCPDPSAGGLPSGYPASDSQHLQYLRAAPLLSG